MGLAGALLVFTGIWHLTEWIMDRRTPDTMRLIPFGFAYLFLGTLIAFNIAVSIVAVIALITVLVGVSLAFLNRRKLDVRRWVIWAYIIIGILIVLALLRHWL